MPQVFVLVWGPRHEGVGLEVEFLDCERCPVDGES